MESSLTDKKNDNFADSRPDTKARFETIFQRLLSGENLDLYAEGVSRIFEVIAANMLADVPERKFHWFDGVADLDVTRRKTRQVIFRGEMWVGDGKKQWKEPFQAIVTDKAVTKQGIWMVLWIGSDRAETNLANAFFRLSDSTRATKE